MQRKKGYVLGGHTFDTVDEYWNAQQDMKKIDIIRRELDVHNPEVAVRLYNMIREGEIAFASPIGYEFTEHVTDVLADKSYNLIDNKKTIDEAEKKVKKQRRIGISIVAMAICAALVFGSSQLSELFTARALENMAKETRAIKIDNAARKEIAEANYAVLRAAAIARKEAMENQETFELPVKVNEADLTILPEYASLYSQYPDFRGWLKIDGTNVDYPLMQRAGDVNNEYYLDKAYDGSNDSNGSLFIDYRSDIVNPTDNTIIYGHNMNSGMMFGDLKNYLEEDYYNSHRTVKFDTLYEEREYEIVAVCLSKVQDAGANDFRYYNFIDARNQAEWTAFVDNVNALSVFSLDSGLKVGDEVLTLSTCNNYTDDGRLFLVAKRVI